MKTRDRLSCYARSIGSHAQTAPEPGREVPKPKITLDLTDYSPRSKSRYVNATATYPDGSEYAYQIRISDHAIDYGNRTGVPPDIFVGVGAREDFQERKPDYLFATWHEARKSLKEIVAEHSASDWQEDHLTPEEEIRREHERQKYLIHEQQKKVDDEKRSAEIASLKRDLSAWIKQVASERDISPARLRSYIEKEDYESHKNDEVWAVSRELRPEFLNRAQPLRDLQSPNPSNPQQGGPPVSFEREEPYSGMDHA